MSTLQTSDGTILTIQTEIEDEILGSYGNLVGTFSKNIKGIDIMAMTQGNQLNMEQRNYLISQVSEEEILKAFKGINDIKSPGPNGYGEQFFKAT